MLTEASYITAKKWKQPKCSSTDKWIGKMWDTHTTEYYSAIKKSYELKSCSNVDKLWRYFAKVKEARHKWSYIIWLHIYEMFSSVAQLCLTLCNPVNRSMPGLPVHHQLPEFTQTHAHRVGDAIQPSHPLLSPSPPAPHPSQHQGLFQWVNS